MSSGLSKKITRIAMHLINYVLFMLINLIFFYVNSISSILRTSNFKHL